MAETLKIVSSLEETEKIKETKAFIKKFCKVDNKKLEELKKELGNLGILKLKRADISKIIDLLPENATEINKIFIEVTLDADETNKILETVKKYK